MLGWSLLHGWLIHAAHGAPLDPATFAELAPALSPALDVAIDTDVPELSIGGGTPIIGVHTSASTNAVAVFTFGDIDIPRHRHWEEMVCQRAGLAPRLPLWQEDRLALLAEWWGRGFTARIVVVRDGVVDRTLLGCELDEALVQQLLRTGIDACGENGEFHTVVTAGPLFRQPLRLRLGEQVHRSGYWFQDVDVVVDDQLVVSTGL